MTRRYSKKMTIDQEVLTSSIPPGEWYAFLCDLSDMMAEQLSTVDGLTAIIEDILDFEDWEN